MRKHILRQIRHHTLLIADDRHTTSRVQIQIDDNVLSVTSRANIDPTCVGPLTNCHFRGRRRHHHHHHRRKWQIQGKRTARVAEGRPFPALYWQDAFLYPSDHFARKIKVGPIIFTRESSFTALARLSYHNSVCLSFCLSVTRMDQSKTVQVRITKFSPSAA